MDNRWTLHVENLGKIGSADITVAPFTMFVGDNNSGKSYLMSILYTLLNIQFSRSRYDMCEDSPEYQCCADWIARQWKDNKCSFNIADDILKQFEALLNVILKKTLIELRNKHSMIQLKLENCRLDFQKP